MVAASNTVVESEIQATLQSLQRPLPRQQTIAMHLPNVAANTTRQPWMVMVKYGKLYPLDVFSSDGRGTQVLNSKAVLVQPRTFMVEPRPGQGEEPESGVTRMVEAFKNSAKTNFYFAFWVYDDSFDAFTRARETAMNLGFQYGWNPLPENRRLQLSRQGEHILPQN